MSGMTEPILGSFRFSQVVNMVTSDLTPEQAVYRTRGGKGASMAWIVGHLMCHRYYVLQLLGAADSNPYETYGGDAGDVAEYPPMSDMLAEWNQLHEKIEAALANTTEEQLMAAPERAYHGEKRILDMVVFHVWHEAYHMGQLGTIRTELGLKSIADVATGK